MSVLSDKWIRKMSERRGNDFSILKISKLEAIVFLMDFPLLAMMQEFLMNSKYLQM